MLQRIICSLAYAVLLFVALPTTAQDTYSDQDELVLPEFVTDAPRYCLLTFPAGEEQRQTVLIVADGEQLYIDKNSDGDLTQSDECVPSTRRNGEPDLNRTFTIDELRCGDRVHKALRINIRPIAKYARTDERVEDLLNDEPDADCYCLSAEIQDDRFLSEQGTGRVRIEVAMKDYNGVLQFGKALELAPTINLCGDLEVWLLEQNRLRPGGETEITVVVGTPGTGPGTFALIGHEQVIPEFANPRLSLRVSVGNQQETETVSCELNKRCGTTEFYGLVKVPETAGEGTAEIALDLNDWADGAVIPTTTNVELLPAIALADRRPVSHRIVKRLVHPDRDTAYSGLAISPDGSRVIVNTYPENTIQSWDAISGKQLSTIETPEEYKSSTHFWEPVQDFSKLYSWVETRGISEQVQIPGNAATKFTYPGSGIFVWDISSGELIEKLHSNPPNQIKRISITPRDTYLISSENRSGTFVDRPRQLRHMMNLETGEWIVWRDDIVGLFIDDNEKIAATTVTNGTDSYALGISVMAFPSLKEIRRIDLPQGNILESPVMFTNDNKYLITLLRTFEHKNVWDTWRTSIICLDLETGELVGRYDYSFENANPGIAKTQLSDGSIVINTREQTPMQVIALQVPDLVPVWDVKPGDYGYVNRGTVSPDGQWVGFVCYIKSDLLNGALDRADWALLGPQSELKIFGLNGSLLENIVLPVGASLWAINDDGKSAAIGAFGSVYMIDLSRPFANEEK